MFKENWTGWKWWLLQHQRYLTEEAVVRTGNSKHFALQHNQMRFVEKEADENTHQVRQSVTGVPKCLCLQAQDSTTMK